MIFLHCSTICIRLDSVTNLVNKNNDPQNMILDIEITLIIEIPRNNRYLHDAVVSHLKHGLCDDSPDKDHDYVFPLNVINNIWFLYMYEQLRRNARSSWNGITQATKLSTKAVIDAAKEVFGDSKTLIMIFIQVFCGAAILTIFYFSYGTTIEHDITQQQADYMYDTIITPYLGLIPSKFHQDFKKAIKQSINSNTESDDDKKVEKQNKKAKSRGYMMLGIIFVIMFVICTGLLVWSWYNKDNGDNGFFQPFQFSISNVTSMIVHILFIAGSILFTEFLFARVIAYNYQSVDINLVKATLLQKMKNEYID